jgi:hypothetical protein
MRGMGSINLVPFDVAYMQPLKPKQGNNMPFKSLWRKSNRLKAERGLLNWAKGRLGTLWTKNFTI